MTIDREQTLRTAERSLSSGKLDAAIAEYTRLVEKDPRDWTIMNTLGDVHLRAGHPAQALALYRRILEHLLKEGFSSKAAALLRKILKIDPNDEAAQLRLGEVLVAQGLMMDARKAFAELERRRRARGDEAGADALILRLQLMDASQRASGTDSAPVAVTIAREDDDVCAAAPAGPADAQPSASSSPILAPPADGGVDLDDVFAGIRARVETTAPGGDPGEYMALAGSYLELGRVDEAIEALAGAATSPRYRFVAAARIAHLLRDRGDIPAAIEWYERAAAAPAHDEEQSRVLLYDLADLLEMMGEAGRALAICLEIAAHAPGYRDLDARIARLSNDAVGG